MLEELVAVELDRKLLPILDETLKEYDNVEIIYGDILKTDVKQLIDEKFDGAHFLHPGSEVGLQAEQLVGGANQPGSGRALLADLCQEFDLVSFFEIGDFRFDRSANRDDRRTFLGLTSSEL